MGLMDWLRPTREDEQVDEPVRAELPAQTGLTTFDSFDSLVDYLGKRGDDLVGEPASGSHRSATNREIAPLIKGYLFYSEREGQGQGKTLETFNKLEQILGANVTYHIAQLVKDKLAIGGKVNRSPGQFMCIESLAKWVKIQGSLGSQGHGKETFCSPESVLKLIHEYAYDMSRVEVGGEDYRKWANEKLELITPNLNGTQQKEGSEFDLRHAVEELVAKKLRENPKWKPREDKKWLEIIGVEY